MKAAFEVFKNDYANEYNCHLTSYKGEPLLRIDSAPSKINYLHNIDAIKINSAFDMRYDRLVTSNGMYYFVLRAANGSVIGRSGLYYSSLAREFGIEAVKQSAPQASVIDRS